MNIEDRMVRKIDQDRSRNRLELSPTMALAYEKANGVLSNPDYAIREADFIPVYGPEIVAADTAFANRLKSEFDVRDTPEEKKLKQIADIFEAIVLIESESSEWFGNARTLKTSPFDDYINKVDMIAEWFTPEDGSRLLALAVDVTFGTKNIQRKLEAIKMEIDSGKLGSIKYFKDERGDFIGTRNNVPRTVIGVSESLVEELAGLWVAKNNKALGEHPIQRLFLDEIETQLNAMYDYALKQGKSDVALAYKQVLGVVRPIRESKLPFRSREIARDTVATEIVLDTEKLFHP